MTAEPFLRAALVAIDEAGDPTAARATIEAALVEAAPLARIARPANAKKRAMWAARQLAMAADNPARAYSRLRELLAALFEPFAGAAHPVAPAPEVAAALKPAAMIDALAPPPRVLSRDIASAAKLDPRALLADAALARRVLAIRAIPQASIGGYAAELAAMIAGGEGASAVSQVEDSILRAEVIAICVPAAEKTRSKVATALVLHLASTDGRVRASAIDGLHALQSRLDPASLLAGMRDPVAAV